MAKGTFASEADKCVRPSLDLIDLHNWQTRRQSGLESSAQAQNTHSRFTIWPFLLPKKHIWAKEIEAKIINLSVLNESASKRNVR